MFSQWGRWGKTSVQTSSNRFLKTLAEGTVTTEAGSLFHVLKEFTNNALATSVGSVFQNGTALRRAQQPFADWVGEGRLHWEFHKTMGVLEHGY